MAKEFASQLMTEFYPDRYFIEVFYNLTALYNIFLVYSYGSHQIQGMINSG